VRRALAVNLNLAGDLDRRVGESRDDENQAKQNQREVREV
jgi:hypothetical protein